MGWGGGVGSVAVQSVVGQCPRLLQREPKQNYCDIEAPEKRRRVGGARKWPQEIGRRSHGRRNKLRREDVKGWCKKRTHFRSPALTPSTNGLLRLKQLLRGWKFSGSDCKNPCQRQQANLGHISLVR